MQINNDDCTCNLIGGGGEVKVIYDYKELHILQVR